MAMKREIMMMPERMRVSILRRRDSSFVVVVVAVVMVVEREVKLRLRK